MGTDRLLIVALLLFYPVLLFSQPSDTSSVVINEVMVNPSPGGPVYVELYNKSQKYISLQNCKIGRFIDGKFSNYFKLTNGPTLFIAPGEYKVFTSSSDSLFRHYPHLSTSTVFQVPRIPAFGRYTGNIAIASDTIPIQWLYYDKSMLSPVAERNAGYALERIDVNKPIADTLNWYTSSDSGLYGTPGGPNRVKTHPVKTLNPEPVPTTLPQEVTVFTPDADGYNDKAIVIEKAASSAPTTVTLLIYDRQGRPVKSINSWTYQSGYLVIEWNGTNDAGKMCLEGSYFIFISASGTGLKIQKVREVVLTLGY